LKKTSFKNAHNYDFYKSSWNDKNKYSTKTFPSNFSKKKPLPNIEFLKKTLPPLPLSHPPKPQVENALNV